MTDYTAIADSEIDKDSPLTAPVMQKLRDNPIGISEGKGPSVAAGNVVVFRMGYGKGADNDTPMWLHTHTGSSASVYSADGIGDQTNVTIYRAGTYRFRFGGVGDGGTSSGNNSTLWLYRKPIGSSAVSIGSITWPAQSDTGFAAFDNSGSDYKNVTITEGDQIYFRASCRNSAEAGPVYLTISADRFVGPIGA